MHAGGLGGDQDDDVFNGGGGRSHGFDGEMVVRGELEPALVLRDPGSSRNAMDVTDESEEHWSLLDVVKGGGAPRLSWRTATESGRETTE